MNKKKRGFTLIELLVVVLIIGILASVALPQYNKAVRKARLSEVATTFNSISKGIDMYLLENGGYKAAQFSGTSKEVNLDIDLSCATEDNVGCYTKTGDWQFYCYSDSCRIELSSRYKTDQTTGNKWLDEGTIYWVKEKENPWIIEASSIDGPHKADVCRWWGRLYGADRVLLSGSPSSICNSYL